MAGFTLHGEVQKREAIIPDQIAGGIGSKNCEISG
jgi:hypothetical protein